MTDEEKDPKHAAMDRVAKDVFALIRNHPDHNDAYKVHLFMHDETSMCQQSEGYSDIGPEGKLTSEQALQCFEDLLIHVRHFAEMCGCEVQIRNVQEIVGFMIPLAELEGEEPGDPLPEPKPPEVDLKL